MPPISGLKSSSIQTVFIITGVSMLGFFSASGIQLSLWTVIVGHGTALTAIVVTNVFARLQRFDRRIEEASSDLGARP